MRRFDPALGAVAERASRLAWRPAPAWFGYIAALAVWSIALIPQGRRLSEFLYFQF
jgi:hypothetical protein